LTRAGTSRKRQGRTTGLGMELGKVRAAAAVRADTALSGAWRDEGGGGRLDFDAVWPFSRTTKRRHSRAFEFGG
jgi:hypothetical protein